MYVGIVRSVRCNNIGGGHCLDGWSAGKSPFVVISHAKTPIWKKNKMVFLEFLKVREEYQKYNLEAEMLWFETV